MLVRALVVLAVSSLVAGCAAPPKQDWVKANTTTAQKEDAVSECTYQIKLNKAPTSEQSNLLTLCMQGKGFRYQRVG